MDQRLPAAYDPQPIVIERVTPEIDGGLYAIKRVVGDTVTVSALVFKDGHDLLDAAVLHRALGTGDGESESEWLESPMKPTKEGLREGTFQVQQNGAHEYTVIAWLDAYGTWARDLRKRIDAGQDVTVDLIEGRALVASAIERAPTHERKAMERAVRASESAPDAMAAADILAHEVMLSSVRRWQPRALVSRYVRDLPLWVDRPRARFASWYEFFPRSEGAVGKKSGTFRTASERLAAVAAMGFDVLYLPPIHPIGRTARKGPNNTLTPGPDDPGSPWAIGGEAGGHTAVEPALGTLADFDAFVAKAKSLGLEIALDFAIQCSPDHPWVKEHPEWFFHRPDGSIRYAENPPKKYQDIYPINFWGAHREALWNALYDVVRFWIDRGIRTFRVDNPHTKPVSFWQWLIARVRETHPEVVFLSEAFTLPWMMQALAKVGFSQSYTYFTWRVAKWELEEYGRELHQSPMREYFRGNLWPNTPDILPAHLQEGGRPTFMARAVLAATMSSAWGMYAGYELAENTRLRPGAEEYLDSEKFQLRPRDWNLEGSLAPYITRLNSARRAHRALQLYGNIDFIQADDPHVIAYIRATPDRSNVVIVVVNLDPTAPRASDLWFDPALAGVGTDEDYAVRDLLSDEVFNWRGGHTWVRLDPLAQPAHVLVVQRGGRGGH